MKSFDKWVDELRDQVNAKPDLPEGIVVGNVDGEYLYQCRSCGDWNPIDWDLDEDSYDGHYCGKGPSCCPLPNVSPGAPKGRVAPAPPMPSAPPPPPKAPRGTHVICSGCNMRIPANASPRHHYTGEEFCGSKQCDQSITYRALGQQRAAPPPPAPVRPVSVCAGCSVPLTNDKIVYDKVTGAPTCGRHTCMAFVQKRSKLF